MLFGRVIVYIFSLVKAEQYVDMDTGTQNKASRNDIDKIVLIFMIKSSKMNILKTKA